MELFDHTIVALDAALGAAGMRQQTIAANIANVNTPGYKRGDVQFDSVLQKAFDSAAESGDTSGLKALSPTVQFDKSNIMRADGNSVDIDAEMASLAETNVRYNALVQMASKEMSMLEYVISDGRR